MYIINMMTIKRAYITIFSILGVILLVSSHFSETVSAMALDFTDEDKHFIKIFKDREGRLSNRLYFKVRKVLSSLKSSIKAINSCANSIKELSANENVSFLGDYRFRSSIVSVLSEENLSSNYIDLTFLKSTRLLVTLYILMLLTIILSLVVPPLAFVIYCIKLLICVRYLKNQTDVHAFFEKVKNTTSLPSYVPLIDLLLICYIVDEIATKALDGERLLSIATILPLIITYIQSFVKAFDICTGHIECIDTPVMRRPPYNETFSESITLKIARRLAIPRLALLYLVLMLVTPITFIVYASMAELFVTSVKNQTTSLIVPLMVTLILICKMPTFVLLTTCAYISFMAEELSNFNLDPNATIITRLQLYALLYVIAVIFALDAL